MTWKIFLAGVFAAVAIALPARAQLVVDPGFELSTPNTWVTNSAASFIETNAHAGTHCAKIGPHGTILQKLQNLTPATAYVLTAYVQIEGSGKAMLGVQKYGGTFVSTKQTTAPTYQQIKLNFTTGTADTSAEILVSNGSDSGTVYADDIDVAPAPPEAASAPAPAPTPATP